MMCMSLFTPLTPLHSSLSALSTQVDPRNILDSSPASFLLLSSGLLHFLKPFETYIHSNKFQFQKAANLSHRQEVWKRY